MGNCCSKEAVDNLSDSTSKGNKNIQTDPIQTTNNDQNLKLINPKETQKNFETSPILTINIEGNLSNDLQLNTNQLSSNFSFQIQLEDKPICIAIGDIEGNIGKLRSIYDLIINNPSFKFVFIGDLINDISDDCEQAEQNWECISLLSQFFTDSNGLSFEPDSKKKTKNEDVIFLPSGFKKIQFGYKNFDQIDSRVKFIAGNAECDALSDIMQRYQIKVEDGETKYIFPGRWKKTLNFEKMVLLYRYFSSCCGIIELINNRPNMPSNNNNFIDTVFFRHAPYSFNANQKMIIQEPDFTKLNDQNFVYVVGHIKKFTSQIQKNSHVYIIDNSSSKKFNKTLALVSFNSENGYEVKMISLPCDF